MTRPRTALVLGASSGVGAAVARMLAGSGHTVSLCARRERELKAICDDITASGGHAVKLARDLSVPGAAEEVVRWTQDELGEIDILVSCAGMARLSPLHEYRFQWWERQLRLNSLVNVEAAAAVLPSMRARRSGWIIIIGSAAGLSAVPGTGGYGVSKAAAHHVAKVLCAENRGHGIHVHALCPGWVRTELAADPHTLGVPEELLLQAEDIAEVVRWLVALPARVQIGPVIEVQPLDPAADATAGIARFVGHQQEGP
ncbi:SDR family oxidoreductase [Austwickia chelonae]|uniref:SDR family oxidoreductase n=1 Tax=Austwickia chelonae TaxID=100225 RepID=UPI0013C31CAF|nr:SDR family oxidoreductase [Austwickia chelonae]